MIIVLKSKNSASSFGDLIGFTKLFMHQAASCPASRENLQGVVWNGFPRQMEGGARKLLAKVRVISGQDYYFWGREMAGVLSRRPSLWCRPRNPRWADWHHLGKVGTAVGPGVKSRFSVMGCSTSDLWGGELCFLFLYSCLRLYYAEPAQSHLFLYPFIYILISLLKYSWFTELYFFPHLFVLVGG